jgi:hypothetical protein
VGPNVGLEVLEKKRRHISPAEIQTPDCQASSICTIMTTLFQLPEKDKASYNPVLYKTDDSLEGRLPISFTTLPAYVVIKHLGPLQFRSNCSFEETNVYTFRRTLVMEVY